MFLLKTTSAARSPIIGEKFNIPIYTGEIKKHVENTVARTVTLYIMLA